MKGLKGYKTYLVVAVAIIANGAYAIGYIPDAAIPLVNTLLGFLGLAALRNGIK